jgi:RES domain-containing protein
MTGIPSPPAQLPALRLVIVEVEPHTLLRIAWRAPASHATFRRESRNRFDAPDGSFGTLYAAFDLETAFVEAVLRERPTHISTSRIPLDFIELEKRVVVNFQHQGRPAASPDPTL